MICDLFRCLFQCHRVMRLLHGINGIALCLQVFYCVKRLLVVLPLHRFFGSEGSLVYLCIWRTATDAAQHDSLNTHRIGGTKNSTYVMLAAHIIQDHHQRQFVRLFILLYVHSTHFGRGQFFHIAKGKLTCRIRASSSISMIKSS